MNFCKIPCENFGKKIEYKTVDVTTVKGLNQAEKLHNAGWKTSKVGPFSVQYYRYI